MAKIVIETYKITPIWKIKSLVNLVNKLLENDEEVKEIRIEE